jgi:hypothetical protein
MTTSTTCATSPTVNTDESANLGNLASALNSNFNSTVGMVFATNTGKNVLSGYPQDETYWMENDNGQVVWALQPYFPSTSKTVNQTLQYYTSKYNVPPSDHIEVFWGLPIPTTFHNSKNYIIESTPSYVVLDEIHNLTSVIHYQNYEDLLIIHSLNNYLRGNQTGAMEDFCQAMSMWDGSGIVDKASATGNYSDYKLAYLIYDAHVLNVWSSNLTIIEQTLWSHQLSNNHIALNYGSLIKNGISKTYNAETDSDVLLAYNPTLIAKMQSLEGAYSTLSATCDSRCLPENVLPAPQFPYLGSLAGIVVPLLAIVAFGLVASKFRKSEI